MSRDDLVVSLFAGAGGFCLVPPCPQWPRSCPCPNTLGDKVGAQASARRSRGRSGPNLGCVTSRGRAGGPRSGEETPVVTSAASSGVVLAYAGTMTAPPVRSAPGRSAASLTREVGGARLPCRCCRARFSRSRRRFVSKRPSSGRRRTQQNQAIRPAWISVNETQWRTLSDPLPGSSTYRVGQAV
jgi:hypothetical protein